MQAMFPLGVWKAARLRTRATFSSVVPVLSDAVVVSSVLVVSAFVSALVTVVVSITVVESPPPQAARPSVSRQRTRAAGRRRGFIGGNLMRARDPGARSR